MNIGEQLGWRGYDPYRALGEGGDAAFPVSEQVNLLGRWCDALLQDGLADQGVDERALPRIELTDRNKKEDFVQLVNGCVERSLVHLGGAESNQGVAKFREQ